MQNKSFKQEPVSDKSHRKILYNIEEPVWGLLKQNKSFKQEPVSLTYSNIL